MKRRGIHIMTQREAEMRALFEERTADAVIAARGWAAKENK